MSLDTVVRGDPDGCRRTARHLERLARELDAAAATLTRESHLGVDAFGGLSGDAFRRRAGGLARASEAEGERCDRLGRALEELARDLEDAGRVMAMARSEAREMLFVDAVFIHPPDGALAGSVLAQRAWRGVVALVARARAVEARAQADWEAALRGLADGSTPLPGLPVGPPLPPQVGPHLAPPVRETWAPPTSAPGAGTSHVVSAPGPAPGPTPDVAMEAPGPGSDPAGDPAGGSLAAAPPGPVGPTTGTVVAEPVDQPCAEPWPPPGEGPGPTGPTVPAVCGTPSLSPDPSLSPELSKSDGCGR